MLKHRLIFGPLMILGLVALFCVDNFLDHVNLEGTPLQAVFLGRKYPPAGLALLIFFLCVIPLATRELVAIFRAKGIAADPGMVALSAMSGCLLIYAIPVDLDSQATIAIFASIITLLFLATLVKHAWRGRVEGAIAVGGVTMLALIYVGIFPGFYMATRRWHSAWVVLGVILTTKCCDIGAYFTGRAIGRHKLIPWLSPGKTWEGLIGGMVLSSLAAVLLAMLANHLDIAGVYSREGGQRVFTPTRYPLAWALLSGAILALVGQFGDLVASLLKRDAGIKDSGQSIPGFGGFIDVVDSPVIVAPVAYWLLYWLSHAH